MDCCKRLLAELGRPEEERDAVVPLTLWSSALIAYARCFGQGRRSGLAVEDVGNLPLQGAIINFHESVVRNVTAYEHAADPFAAAKIGPHYRRPGKNNGG